MMTPQRSPLDFAALARPVALALLGEPNSGLSTAAELRYGRKGSLAVRLDSGQRFDHESGAGGGVIALARALTRAEDFPNALRRLTNFAGTRVAVQGSIAPVRLCSRAKLKTTDTQAAALAERLESAGRAATIRTLAALGADFADLLTRGSVGIGLEASQ